LAQAFAVLQRPLALHAELAITPGLASGVSQ